MTEIEVLAQQIKESIECAPKLKYPLDCDELGWGMVESAIELTERLSHLDPEIMIWNEWAAANGCKSVGDILLEEAARLNISGNAKPSPELVDAVWRRCEAEELLFKKAPQTAICSKFNEVITGRVN